MGKLESLPYARARSCHADRPCRPDQQPVRLRLVRAPQAVIGYGAKRMFAGWENYYLMIGPSAAALIGLMFVVVTLTAGRERKQVERGKHLYTSPIVWHLAVVMVLSGGAAAPTMNPRLFGAVAAALAVLGIGMGIRNA